MEIDDLKNVTVGTKIILNYKGVEIPIFFWPAAKQSNAVIFTFHGSVNRKERVVPVFGPIFSELITDAHQVAIFDISLFRHDATRVAWYAGHDELDLQSLLKEVFQQISQVLECTRKIYFGSSGGGFAALFYSWHDKGSIAISANPQIILEAYYEKYTDQFLKNHWPNKKSFSDLDAQITTDLTRLYKTKASNTVLYIQNGTDRHHVCRHMTAFMVATAKSGSDIIYKSDFWGAFGHSAPPKDVLLSWLQAAIHSDTTTPNDIILKNHEAVNAQNTINNTEKTSLQKKTMSGDDINTANAIAKWSLS